MARSVCVWSKSIACARGLTFCTVSKSDLRRGSRNDHLSAIIRYCKHFMLHLFPNYFHLKSCTVYSHYDKFYVIV
ncbi:unnamed protein product [Schistosoma guineensis]|nr:unnamed protein product [Schistosoma guineensis]